LEFFQFGILNGKSLSSSVFFSLSKECGSFVSGCLILVQFIIELVLPGLLVCHVEVDIIEDSLCEVSLRLGGIVVTCTVVHGSLVLSNHLNLPFGLGSARLDNDVDCQDILLNSFNVGVSVV
jgi:hypothetical protein